MATQQTSKKLEKFCSNLFFASILGVNSQLHHLISYDVIHNVMLWMIAISTPEIQQLWENACQKWKKHKTK